MSKLAKILMSVVAALGLLLAVVLFTTYYAAHACECCADPVVRVEWADKWIYEFTDGSIVVTGTERLLCWQVVSGTAISKIRTKAGQDIECWYPQGTETASGCIEAGRHDFSNAQFCKEGSTAVELSSFTADSIEDEGAFPWMTHTLAVIAGLIAGMWLGLPGDKR